jgi:diacylglycerol kinase family enzyme
VGRTRGRLGPGPSFRWPSVAELNRNIIQKGLWQRMIVVLINPKGGTAQGKNAVADLLQLLAARLPKASVEVVPHGDQLIERARAAYRAGAEVVAAAGGDGTLSAVAQALVGSDVRLGVIPIGTRNHFALDVGVPLDLGQAVDLLASGTARQIDVGAVNDAYFINNASVGLYPQLVDLRDQGTWPPSKMLRTYTTVFRLAFVAKPIPVQLECSDLRMKEFVWLIFVGNNSYNLGLYDSGRRIALDTGQIELVAVPARSRWTLARLILNAARGHVRPRYVQRIESERADVQVPVEIGASEVALDGEIRQMEGSLIIRSVPQSLWVIAPQ